MKKQTSYQTALSKAMAICSQQEKCVIEVEEKLNLWNISKTDIDKIISQLKKDKFIDESRFAKAFVNDKLKFNHWGKQKMKYALFQKRISENIINVALNKIQNEEYIQILKQELEKKRNSLYEKDEYKLKEKLIRFASSKGFEIDVIYKVIESIL